ncbi:probable G-protein coupled receptor B0563.6 [Penaeus monodon]|uniref:probable G-protein coupled receptor B0563.6 n=1 Tax=Penaeus monodon TaxID=6687 RepID=UPI0018A70662|nr:probable G-protein coupled receptor B0563.6 [Penaeus monodon]
MPSCDCMCVPGPPPLYQGPLDYISANYIAGNMLSLRDHRVQPNCTQEREHEEVHWAVYQIVFPVLVSIGVLANLLNLVVLSRPAMKGVSYRYLNHLAVSDLMYLLFNVPFCLEAFSKISHEMPVPRPAAFYYAHVGIPLVNLFLTMSEYIVVWLSYDRCLAVCRPHKFSSKQRLEVVRVRCLMSLALTICVYSLSPLSQTFCCEGADCCVIDSTFTKENVNWYTAYELFREIYSRFLPAIIITCFNAAIIYTLRQLKREREGRDIINESRQERERRLFFLLMAITVFFYVSAIPSAMYKIIQFNDVFPNFRAVADILEVSGHVFNFVLYFLFSPDYRRTLVGMTTGQPQMTVQTSSFHA